MTKNMCDGCQQGLSSITKDGIHDRDNNGNPVYIVCTKDRYQPTTEEELRKKYNKFWGYNMCNQKEFDEIADWWLEQLRLAVEEATHCKKTIPGDGIHGDGICSVKLDCHLHDWRQKDAIAEAVKKERETLLKGIISLRKPENGEEIDYTVAQEFNLEYNSALTDVANIIRSREQ